MKRGRPVALLLLIAVALLPAVAEAKQKKKDRSRGAVVAPVRLVSDDDVALQVAGQPSYFGELRLPAASDGLVIVDRLPLERYLLGLNEVPLDWPMEALKAQAVAARTYALWTLEQPAGGSAATYGFDICATVACQVFSGADVMRLNSDADRWRRAVTETAGEAILYDGEPILARYHSTSGGQTLANDQVFTDGSFPYLQPVPSTAEEASPLYRWRVRFPFERAQRMLEVAALWGERQGRLRGVEVLDSEDGNHYPDLRFVGSKRNVRMDAQAFREIARDRAPALWPNDYPSTAPASGRPLPETLPSNRYTVIERGNAMIVVGGGWGHGVGMSQWGAEGMARAGDTYEEILNHYYTGVEIGPYDAPPRVDVGVGWQRSEVTVTGAFELLDGRDRRLVRNAVGTWTFRYLGTGAVEVIAPKRFGLPLEVGFAKGPDSVSPGQRIKFPITLTAPAKVRLEAPEGAQGDPVVKDAGRSKIAWEAPQEPGLYELTVVASDGTERTRDRIEIAVMAVPSPSPSPAPSVGAATGGGRVTDASWTLWIALVLGGAAILVVRKVTM